MSDTSDDPISTVEFGPKFAESEMFRQTFKEGMALVEETANYLDGSGREEARGLAKTAALAYATESMRLTTRLMQIASWLLIQRAVAEGEIPAREAFSDSTRVPLKPPITRRERPDAEDLPRRLRDLIERTDRIYSRLYRLDKMLAPTADASEADPNPVVVQFDRLKAEFGGGAE